MNKKNILKPYGYIYLTTNKINGKKYIGQHSKPIFDKHYYGSGKLIKQALKKYGYENFICEVIEWCYSYEEINEREKYWIKYYNADLNNNFYNKAMGGSNTKYSLRKENHPFYNKKHKPESIEKMRLSKQGNNNPMYGKHHTKQTKEKMSNAQLGELNHMYGKGESSYWYNKHRDEKTKEKISQTRIKNQIAVGEKNPYYGKKHTGEEKRKMSEQSKDRIWITNGIQNKRVKKAKLEEYFKNNWRKGRI